MWTRAQLEERNGGKAIHLFTDMQLLCVSRFSSGQELEDVAFNLLLPRINSFKQLHDLIIKGGSPMPSIGWRLLSHFSERIETAEDAIWIFRSYHKGWVHRHELAERICELASHEELKTFVKELVQE